MTSSQSFEVGERILARNINSPIFYDAKIVEVINKRGKEGYTVHYQGWNKKHDEFIGVEELEDRTKKFTEEDFQEAKEAMAAAKAKEARKRRRTMLIVEKSRDGTPHSQDDNESTAGTENNISTSPQFQFDFPNLKIVIAKDYKLVHRQNGNYSLPAKISIENIIHDYLREAVHKTPEHYDIQLKYLEDKVFTARSVIQYSQLLLDYFNRLLPRQLLYPSEKAYYQEALTKIKKTPVVKKRGSSMRAAPPVPIKPVEFKPTVQYGLPHILRILLRFDDIMNSTPFDERTRKAVLNVMADITGYLNENYQKYYKGEADYIFGVSK